jgi:ElaB/YqjD/DUF883 family membrane-anchored ribosome-binding protein
MDAFDNADSAAQAFEDAAARTAEIRKRVEERAAAARDWAVDQSDVLRDTVQTRPFISVGVSAATAFAAGLILGVLLARAID